MATTGPPPSVDPALAYMAADVATAVAPPASVVPSAEWVAVPSVYSPPSGTAISTSPAPFPRAMPVANSASPGPQPASMTTGHVIVPPHSAVASVTLPGAGAAGLVSAGAPIPQMSSPAHSGQVLNPVHVAPVRGVPPMSATTHSVAAIPLPMMHPVGGHACGGVATTAHCQ